ncbi:hypothetical protein BTUL_0026g00780 [Botrytis tulipae]|uniref:Uncharacterized protein n=2 Tax=Botrytis TaxID=33196 RepID=A0A4S8QLW7_9HELO|nr:hypothetical protein EAF00_004502 [Botryotinia globosa]TGO16624.1 hypothetical protein BTUL_0026g00780 [Botrytis tulipae]THV44055.1 hypothetical protein BGAL_0749g00020 [Botrytis galanthina]
MTGSFWHNVLTFRRPSSSTSSTSTTSDSIDSSSSSTLNLSVRSSHRLSRKRREVFGDFDYTFDNESMNANMQEPLGMERNSLGKDTGFPEPLSHDRNTTLPHPEADTSPFATLESTEVDIYRSHSRLSIRRLHSRHKGSHLSVPLYESNEYTNGNHVHGDMKTIEKDVEKQNDLVDPPKTVEEFVEMEDRDDQGYRPGDRRKGVLRKLNLHKV